MIDIKPEERKQILQLLEVHFPSAKAYVFGSRTQGRARKYSDLDLAIDQGSIISFEKMSKMNEAFAQTSIPFKIDIVDLCTVSKDFRQHILDTGKEFDHVCD